MPIHEIPTLGFAELGAIGTLGILLLGIYRYKANNLETIREREARLRNLEGKSVKEDKFMVTVDNIELDELRSLSYRFKRLVLRPPNGTIYITFRLHQIGVPEEFWEMDHADVFYETFDFSVECVSSDMTSRYTVLVFKLQTSDYLDLKQFLDQFTNFLKVLENSGTVSVVDTRTGHPIK